MSLGRPADESNMLITALPITTTPTRLGSALQAHLRRRCWLRLLLPLPVSLQVGPHGISQLCVLHDGMQRAQQCLR